MVCYRIEDNFPRHTLPWSVIQCRAGWEVSRIDTPSVAILQYRYSWCSSLSGSIKGRDQPPWKIAWKDNQYRDSGAHGIGCRTESNECFFFDFKEDGTYTIFKQKAVHRNDSNDEVVFEMDEESDGSIRLLDFIPMLIDLSQSESDYMIDELDRSMHPLLSQMLIECYLQQLSTEGTHTDYLYSRM